jgi:AraC family transcriptional regulator, ethanolamine operon transcriptional activator
MSAVQYASHERDSLDEFILDIRDFGVEVMATQLDRDTQPSSLEVVGSANTNVMRYAVGSRTHHLLGARSGYHTFGFLAGPQLPTRIASREFGPADILQVDPRSGLDAVIEAGFSGYTFSVKENRLREVAALQGVEDLSMLSLGLGGVKPVPGAYRTQLRNSLEQMILLSRAHPQTMAVRDFLDSELPALLVRGWCYERLLQQKNHSPASRGRVLRRAVELVRAEGGETVTVERLCRETASSYSTLERAFRERFGISPKRYLTQSRLSAVRRALLRGDGRTVTEIAHTCGFAHMGKFSADYRRQFGELPSRTRRA